MFWLFKGRKKRRKKKGRIRKAIDVNIAARRKKYRPETYTKKLKGSYWKSYAKWKVNPVNQIRQQAAKIPLPKLVSTALLPRCENVRKKNRRAYFAYVAKNGNKGAGNKNHQRRFDIKPCR